MKSLEEEAEEYVNNSIPSNYWAFINGANSKYVQNQIIEAKEIEKSKNNKWIKVTERLPEPDERVLRYTPNVNISQKNMAVQIIDGNILKYAEEETWWMPIPKLPAPLKIN
jgi:hypothetical protein